MRRRVVCPRSHPASLFLFSGSLAVPGTRADSNGPDRQQDTSDRLGRGFPPYSVLRNSAIATAVLPRPMMVTIPSDRPSGTTHPAQVMPGDRCCSDAAALVRWLDTACRNGPPMYMAGSSP